MAVIKGLPGLEVGRLNKNVVKTFKDCGLIIIIEANLHTVNYLDVTFDPKSISERLSDLRSNEDIFEKPKPAYSDALNKSGFQEKLSYTSAQSNNDKNDNK